MHTFGSVFKLPFLLYSERRNAKMQSEASVNSTTRKPPAAITPPEKAAIFSDRPSQALSTLVSFFCLFFPHRAVLHANDMIVCKNVSPYPPPVLLRMRS